MMKKKLFTAILCTCALQAFAYRTTDSLLDSDWKFHFGEAKGAEVAKFDDTNWENVKVPHDWAIDKPFDFKHDAEINIFEQKNGELYIRTITGRTGCLPSVGIGWYRKTLELPKAMSDKRVYVQFDGAMSYSQVWINGNLVGGRPYGYTSFEVDITKYFKFDEKNILAVRLDNPPLSSRWYTGGGLYRDVRLVTKPQTNVAFNGVCITTSSVSESSADCKVVTEIEDFSNNAKDLQVRVQVISPEGKTLANSETNVKPNKGKTQAINTLKISNPALWDIETPTLHTAKIEILSDGKVVDTYLQKFGIRSISYDREKGFRLNGKRVQFKGVCLHHDLGPIGTAFNVSAARRQLEIMKDMGANAIRTSHNPPAPAFLDLCDEMGLLVQVEAFDEWKMTKMRNGYHKLFDEWAERDLTDLIKRDRNHPCVVMWSIGNEVEEQKVDHGYKTVKYLYDIAKKLDDRPITAGMNFSGKTIHNGFAAELDIQGCNYKAPAYNKYTETKKDMIFFGSETVSTLSSRGIYHFPAKREVDPWHWDYQVSSYDLSGPVWSYAPDYEWFAHDKNPLILGEFVWTGFDYLGEPFPYTAGGYISRSSYYGIVDLAGLPKDRFYLYRSHWNKKSETLYILPHWNWEEREGKNVPVFCYTNYPKAELFVNGKSMGIREKDDKTFLTKYRLMWNDVIYQAGEIKVVAYDKNGKKVAEKTVKTAGEPTQLSMKADRKTFGGKELCFVEVSVLDKNGNLCPRATNRIFFECKGNIKLKALCNGDPIDMTAFSSKYMQAFSGKLVAVLECDTLSDGDFYALSGKLKYAKLSFKPNKKEK